MTSIKNASYKPNGDRKQAYDKLYALYLKLHDAFGGVDRQADLSSVMKSLIAIKNQAASSLTVKTDGGPIVGIAAIQ